jgi:hypothetical protein
MSIKLKIKYKSLAEETRIIKKEEAKQLGWARYLLRVERIDNAEAPAENNQGYWERTSLREHRLKDLRPMLRATHLARAYLRGTPYLRVENKVLPGNELTERQIEPIVKMVKTHGVFAMAHGAETRVRAWLSGSTETMIGDDSKETMSGQAA